MLFFHKRKPHREENIVSEERECVKKQLVFFSMKSKSYVQFVNFLDHFFTIIFFHRCIWISLMKNVFFLFLFLFLVILFLFFSLSLFTLSYAFLCRRPCSNITETKITDDTIIPHPHAPARFIPSLTHPHTRPLSPGLLPRSLNPVIPYFRFPPTCFCPSGPPPPISLPSHHTPTTPPRGLRTIFTCISP